MFYEPNQDISDSIIDNRRKIRALYTRFLLVIVYNLSSKSKGQENSLTKALQYPNIDSDQIKENKVLNENENSISLLYSVNKTLNTSQSNHEYFVL